MEDQDILMDEGTSEGYDAADRLFHFMLDGVATALVCEPDPAVREKISGSLKELEYQITAVEKATEALKLMRFHIFDVVVVNDRFDAPDPDANEILRYLQNQSMSIRRRFFVILVTARFRTMDNMAAFNRSVNLILNLRNVDDAGKIIKQGLAENRAFYRVFHEASQRAGKT